MDKETETEKHHGKDRASLLTIPAQFMTECELCNILLTLRLPD